MAAPSKITSFALRLLAIIKWASLAFFAIFMWQFYTFYWQFRHPLSLEDRYYNPEDLVVYHAQSKFIIVPALLCLFVFVMLHYGVARVRQKVAS